MKARVILAAFMLSGFGLMVAEAQLFFFCDITDPVTMCGDESCTGLDETAEIFCQETGGYVLYNRVNVEGWGAYNCYVTPAPSDCPLDTRDCDKVLYYKSPPVYDPEDCEVAENRMCTISDPQQFCRAP